MMSPTISHDRSATPTPAPTDSPLPAFSLLLEAVNADSHKPYPSQDFPTPPESPDEVTMNPIEQIRIFPSPLCLLLILTCDRKTSDVTWLFGIYIELRLDGRKCILFVTAQKGTVLSLYHHKGFSNHLYQVIE